MYSIFTPNIKELFATLTLLYLIFSFYFNGLLISKKKDFSINLLIGWSLFSLIFIFFGAILKIKLNFIIYAYSTVNLIIIFINFYKIRFYQFKNYIFLLPILS